MCTHTVFLDNGVQALACWNDIIAVGSGSGDIIILDTITGSQKAVLSGHTDWVTSITFSSDGISLVSGSYDETVKLWDVQTGGVVRTFSGHTHYVCSVSISADCTAIASGSYDGRILLWSIETGECYTTIQQKHPVEHVNFTPTDSQHLISTSGGKVWEWDGNGHQTKPPYQGFHIAFSPDGTLFASCNLETVTIQKSDSREIVVEFEAGSIVQACCFSPDNRLMAAGGTNLTAYVWNITSLNPCLIGTFTTQITSLVFSSPSCLISGSDGGSVKFWKIGAVSTDTTVMNSKSTSPISIQSINLQAKDSVIITSDSHGVVQVWDILTGHCKASFQTPAEGHNNRRDSWMAGGQLIITWHADRKINIYDAESGKNKEVDCGSNWVVRGLKISGDGSKVFCLNLESIQAWSVQTGGYIGKVEVEGHPKSLIVDGSKVWVHSTSLGYEGWDFMIPGSLPVQLPSMPVHWFHPNGTILWDPLLDRIKDKVTGKVLIQLPRRFAKPADVQWNGQHLVLCYLSKEVLILDFSHLLL